METDIGQPIDYNPSIHLPKEEPLPEQQQHYEDSSPIDEYMQHPSHMYMEPPPQQMYYSQHSQPMQTQQFDITSLDKNTYLMAFVAFLLGFFMGKTMISPVIFRNP